VGVGVPVGVGEGVGVSVGVGCGASLISEKWSWISPRWLRREKFISSRPTSSTAEQWVIALETMAGWFRGPVCSRPEQPTTA
jgi:hypothetical protein